MGERIYSPLIPPGTAEIVIAFEPAEAVRILSFLSESGTMIVLNRAIPPVTSSLGAPYDPRLMPEYLAARLGAGGQGAERREKRLFVIDGEDLIQRCGSPRVINTALLGAALKRGLFPFDAEDVLRVLERRIPERFLALNRRALEIGGELAG
jgi:indolepyruvate ferredoxin oxidoreductase beta subunit